MRWKIGKLVFDPFTRQFGDARSDPLSEPEGKVLEFLIANFRRKYGNEQIAYAAWGDEESVPNLYKAIEHLRERLGGGLEEFIGSRPYRLVVQPERMGGEIETGGVTESINVSDPKTQCEETSNSSTRDFDLVIDGMIINSSGEVILEDPETESIRKSCALSYERSLEDLAFVTVYANRLVAGKDFRPSLTTPDQPGKEVAGRLGDICVHRPFPMDIGNGRLLLNTDFQEKIRSDIQILARCASDRQYTQFFRDYMMRESTKHFGEDNTLFQEEIDPAKYRFNVARPYYTNRELQESFGGATEVFANYLPTHPPSSADPYARNALREFASRNVLSLITIMWEAEEFAKKTGAWRMPHILRAIIIENRPSARRGTDQQELVRSLVVEHALTAVFGRMRRKNRATIVAALLNLRDEHPFKQIRELLNQNHLLFVEPSPKREQDAHKVLRQIKILIGSGSIHPDSFRLAHASTLRAIGRVRSAEYEAELHRVFPEFVPAPN